MSRLLRVSRYRAVSPGRSSPRCRARICNAATRCASSSARSWKAGSRCNLLRRSASTMPVSRGGDVALTIELVTSLVHLVEEIKQALLPNVVSRRPDRYHRRKRGHGCRARPASSGQRRRVRVTARRRRGHGIAHRQPAANETCRSQPGPTAMLRGWSRIPTGNPGSQRPVRCQRQEKFKNRRDRRAAMAVRAWLKPMTRLRQSRRRVAPRPEAVPPRLPGAHASNSGTQIAQ